MSVKPRMADSNLSPQHEHSCEIVEVAKLKGNKEVDGCVGACVSVLGSG